MDTRSKRAAKRIVAALLLAGGLGGCVYAPPYAAYDPYYSGYGYPTYVGPPVSVDLGFYQHRHYGKHHGGYHRGYHGGHYKHGWRGHGGYGHGGGWGHRRGGRH